MIQLNSLYEDDYIYVRINTIIEINVIQTYIYIFRKILLSTNTHACTHTVIDFVWFTLILWHINHCW